MTDARERAEAAWQRESGDAADSRAVNTEARGPVSRRAWWLAGYEAGAAESAARIEAMERRIADLEAGMLALAGASATDKELPNMGKGGADSRD